MVATSGSHTIGLKVDGTVLMAQDYSLSHIDVSGWKDIVFVALGRYDAFGLKSDGTIIIAEGSYISSFYKERFSQMLFDDIKTLKSKKEEIAKRKANIRKQKRTELTMVRLSLQKELANLKGLFSGSKRRELEVKLAEIEKELNAL